MATRRRSMLRSRSASMFRSRSMKRAAARGASKAAARAKAASRSSRMAGGVAAPGFPTPRPVPIKPYSGRQIIFSLKYNNKYYI